MSNIDTGVKELVINSLTKAQYEAALEAGTISNTELYMITDESYPTFADLANVATTGEYNDLLNKPTIPDAVSELSNDLGFINSSALADYTPTANLANVATTGEYEDILNTPTVDQSYNASSANAQSGVAVANAISSTFVIMNSSTYNNSVHNPGVFYFITED